MTQQTKTALNLARREALGKKNKALRRSGVVPANIYGHRVDSVAVQVPSEELRLLLKRISRNEIIYVAVDGEERPTFIRDIQRNPVTDQILHVDFLQISLTEKVRMEVPLHFKGQSSAVDTLGGILTHTTNHVLVEALPTSVPQSIEVDVSVLTEVGQALHVSDIAPPEGVLIVTDEEVTIVRVDLPAAERAEEEAAAVAVEGEEGAAAPATGAEAAEGGEGE